MKNYRILFALLTTVMLLTVSGCAHEHDWTAADCLTPKTCSSCGETEGEALGHSWTEANYQAPKTCSVCMAVEGDALTAGYVEQGMDAKLLDKNGEYDFTLPCYKPTSKSTTGKLFIESYKTFSSDETHEAMDGYEWKEAVIRVRFNDTNAQKHGVGSIRYLVDDYYHAGKAEEQEAGVDESFDVLWNGISYDKCTSVKTFDYTQWEKDENGVFFMDYIITYTYRIPVGYDGCVIGVSDALMEWPVGTHLYEVIDDTARLFRLD